VTARVRRPGLVASGLVVVLAIAAGGCGARPVDLDGTWPRTADPDYDAVTRAWTRQAEARDDFSMVVDVTATIKTPAWRAAYVARRARREHLSAEARDALLEAQRKADQDAYEVELMVATYDRRANDLNKGARSIWHVALVGDDGHEIAPTEIARDRRPRSEIVSDFPSLGDFHVAYVAKFPRKAALFGEDADRIVLRVASAQAQVDLVWRDR
jgi:hypothetical protein